MSISDAFPSSPINKTSISPGPTTSPSLGGKSVSKISGTSGHPPFEHEHVFTALRSIFEEKISQAPSSADKERLSRSHKEIETYLRHNIESLVQEAKESATGGVSKAKSLTKLSYTLRCLYNKKTGKTSFHISFGTFAEGGEAVIKEVIPIDGEGRHKVFAQRRLKETPPDSSSLSREKAALAIVSDLVQKGVKGIVSQTPVAYTGKRGPKIASLSDKQPGTVYDLLRSLPKELKGERWEERLRIMEEVARTTTSIHKAGIVHFDIKPENILLTKHGRPLLGDFGKAAKVGETGIHGGSFGWAAPELFSGELTEARPESDLWSLGALMYTLATGNAPFIDAQEAINRADTKEGKEQKIEEFRQSVEELRTFLVSEGIEKYLDPDLAKIIAGLLTWDPSQRMSDDQLCSRLGLPR